MSGSDNNPERPLSVVPITIGKGQPPVSMEITAKVKPMMTGWRDGPAILHGGLYSPKPNLSAEGPKIIPQADGNIIERQSLSEYEAALKRSLEGNLKVRWIAPFLDGTGYGEASRNYLAALSTAGVEVIGRTMSFDGCRIDCGRSMEFVWPTLSKTGGYAVNVVFLPPEHFPLYVDNHAYNIGLFDWETDILPSQSVYACNGMDEVWVPSKWMEGIVRKCGVERPTRVFGHCASPEDFEDGPILEFPEIPAGVFKFYSIFQWTERKNPEGLIRAYLKAFTDKDPVILILKTYRCDYSEKEQARVVNEIMRIKEEFGGSGHPKILAILDAMTRDEILAFHRTGDCFSLIHRAEGWGLPHFEASMMGKPVLTTGYSANLEFTTPETAYLVGHKMTHVSGLDWIRVYTQEMSWAEPDVGQCSRLMRHILGNKEEALKKGQAGRSLVSRDFSWEAIGGRIKARLYEIVKSL